MKALKDILKDIIDLPEHQNQTINRLVIDSRQVQPGDCFIAYPGHQLDGRDYIHDAIEQGATAVLYEAEGFDITLPDAFNAIAIPNLSDHVSFIAGNFYDHPSRQLDCIAVTGTNGKTSITQFMAQALTALGKHVAIMGTNGIGTLEHLKPANLTTADAVSVQRILAEFLEQGIHYVVLEASSHALDQHRLAAIELNSAHFTNLTHDHLDYHETMEAYGEAKARLFAQSFLDRALLNVDDEFGQVLYDRFQHVPAYSYSLSNMHADFHVKKRQLHAEGIRAELQLQSHIVEVELHVLGEFNLANVLAVCSELALRGFTPTEIQTAIQAIRPVAGRMHMISAPNYPVVIIDYAHTPDAIKNALLALREHTSGKLWCVFGCGGNRDKEKRKKMGQHADRLADMVVLTDDNPRNERSEQIIEDIMQGISNPEHVLIKPKRNEAIDYVIAEAAPTDVVLIAGKGHEDYQIYGQQRLSFSDIAYVEAIVAPQ